MRVLPTFSNGKVHYISVEEKSFGFYDDFYRKERMYGLPACESVIYPIWDMVARRIGDDERVMDLGCGTGQFAQVLLLRGKKFVLGVDFSVVAIEKAVSMMPFCKFVVGDIYKSSVYELVPYDCVTLVEVMEHLEHDLAILGHIKSGVHVVFTVPNYITEEGSHVRGFLNEGEILERYRKMVEIMNMEEVMMNHKENQKLWIVDGIRRKEVE